MLVPGNLAIDDDLNKTAGVHFQRPMTVADSVERTFGSPDRGVEHGHRP